MSVISTIRLLVVLVGLLNSIVSKLYFVFGSKLDIFPLINHLSFSLVIVAIVEIICWVVLFLNLIVALTFSKTSLPSWELILKLKLVSLFVLGSV